MKLSLLFTSLVALAAAVPAPETVSEASAFEVAGNYGQNYHRCGGRSGSVYGYMEIQYGNYYGQTRQLSVPVYCGGGGRGELINARDVTWARMGRYSGRDQPGCQVRYVPQHSNRFYDKHISSQGTWLDDRRPATLYRVYCNI